MTYFIQNQFRGPQNQSWPSVVFGSVLTNKKLFFFLAPKEQSLALLLKYRHTNTQTRTPSLQPWEWRLLRFKVISSIQQPEALHCQRTTSFCSHMHPDVYARTQTHTYTQTLPVPSTQRIFPTLGSGTAKCLSGENMTLRGSSRAKTLAGVEL